MQLLHAASPVSTATKILSSESVKDFISSRILTQLFSDETNQVDSVIRAQWGKDFKYLYKSS